MSEKSTSDAGSLPNLHPIQTLAILVYEDVEVLDACGPFEVFSVAGGRMDPCRLRVITVAQNPGIVRARNGLMIQPHHTFNDCPKTELLLVPGGHGSRTEIDNQTLIDWIRLMAEAADVVMSVCTGALLLARAGLLDDLDATTHHESIELLRRLAPRTRVHANRRFVDNGKFICSAGIAAGIDMSLYVVARLFGPAVAEETSRYMEYPLRG